MVFVRIRPKTTYMKSIRFILSLLISGLFFISSSLKAQKVYSCDNKYDADVIIFVVDSRYDADLLVYKVASRYDTGSNEGLWHFVESKYDADKKVYFTGSKYDADLLIYFVDSRYDAGWRNKERIYLLY